MCEFLQNPANANWKAEAVESEVIEVQVDLFDPYNPVYPHIHGDPKPGYPIYIGD